MHYTNESRGKTQLNFANSFKRIKPNKMHYTNESRGKTQLNFANSFKYLPWPPSEICLLSKVLPS